MKHFVGLRLTLFSLLFAPLCLTTKAETCVSFSTLGGFYDSSFYLTLSSSQDLSIHYTLNGNEPTFFDKVYEHPLLLNEELHSKSNIYTIQTCSDSKWFVPETIQKCIVIRAAAFDENGNRVSEVTTNSYFIHSLGCNTHGLPVISLCADSLDLFDYNQGLMVPGIYYDSTAALWSGNYNQHGRQWECPCNIEFYEHDNGGINQVAGLRVHGGDSRLGIQKGMRIYARKEYGQKRFCHDFFKNTSINSYKNLVLKPMGSGLVSDQICTQIAQSLNFETPQSRPVVVFLNGEYWGLYFLKERHNESFIVDHYGFNKEDINIIKSWNGNTSFGDNESFIKMMQWFQKADLSNADAYRQACTLIDIDCFIDYYCFQIFISNSDWPHNNMRCWQAIDGKWRWIFYDGDCALLSNPNMLSNIIYNEKNKDASTIVFTKLLVNESFRNQFYERFGELLTHEFDPKNTKTYFDECINTVNPEIDFHYKRFGYTVNLTHYFDAFLSISTVSAASKIYKLYYYNNWEYSKSKTPSQSTFKYKPNCPRPVYLFRMARQFKDWKFVKYYFDYERHRMYYELKNSKLSKSIKSSKLGRRLKREK